MAATTSQLRAQTGRVDSNQTNIFYRLFCSGTHTHTHTNVQTKLCGDVDFGDSSESLTSIDPRRAADAVIHRATTEGVCVRVCAEVGSRTQTRPPRQCVCSQSNVCQLGSGRCVRRAK